jgi:hypothetical protein
MTIKSLLGWAALLGLLVCELPTSSGGYPVPPEAWGEWEITVQTLVSRGVSESAARGVTPDMFRHVASAGPFYCVSVWANGCFKRPRLITWNTLTPHVLRHEYGHAILYKLGYSCSSDFEHTEASCP